MNPARFLLSTGACLLVLASMATPLVADDCISCETLVPVYLTGEFDAAYPPPGYNPWIDLDLSNGNAGKAVWADGTYAFDPGTASLVPGKEYTVTVTGDWVEGYRAHFNPSEGYTVFINGLERNFYDASSTVINLDPLIGMPSDSFSIRVEVVPGSNFTPAGVALPLSSGKVVWRVGMGQLRNGKSAGYMAIRQDNLDATTFQISSLIYESPSPEVDRVPNTGALSQVRAPFGLVTVTTISGGYRLAFYSSATGPVNGYYTPSGSAFVTYDITSQSNYSIMRIDRTRGSQTSRTELKKATASDWQMTDWGTPTTNGVSGIRHDVRRFSSGNLVEETLVKSSLSDLDTAAATRTQDTYVNKAWGRELMSSKADFGVSDLTTTYAYYETTSENGRYTKIKSISRPDGSWIGFDYFDDLTRRGRLRYEFRPFEDDPTTPTFSLSSGRVTTYTYDHSDWNGERRLPTQISTSINSVQVAKTTIAYSSAIINGQPVRIETRLDFSDSTQSLQTVTKTYDKNASDSFFRDLTYCVRRPDGTIDSYVYQNGYVDPATKAFEPDSAGGARRRLVFHGAATNGGDSGATCYSSYSGITMEPLYMIPHQSTMDEEVTGIDGRPLLRNQYLFIGSATFAPIGDGAFIMCTPEGTPSWINNIRRSWSFLDYNSTWVDGLKTADTDSDGIQRSYTYDVLGRLTGITVTAKGAIPALTTTLEYDADNRKVAEERGSSAQIISRWQFDQAGRLTKSTVPGQNGGKDTDYAYFNGGRDVTATQPDGSTIETVRYRDGQTKSVTGTASPPAYYDYTINTGGTYPSGSQTVRHQLASGGSDGAGWSKTTSDWLGRVTEIAHPTFNAGGTNHRIKHTYSPTTGQLTLKETVSGSTGAGTALLPPEHYTYNVMGRLSRVAADVTGGGIATASMDRIRDYEYDSFTESTSRFLRERVYLYATANSATRTLESTRSRRVSGLSATLASEERVTDAAGTTTTTRKLVDQANALVEIETAVSGVGNPGRRTHQNGLLIEDETPSGVFTDYLYDAWWRLSFEDFQASATGGYDVPKTGYIYHSGTDLVSSVRTYYGFGTNDYYTQEALIYDNMNRVKRRQDAYGKITRTAYVIRTANDPTTVYQWGTKTHPTKTVFDTYGQKTELRTYRSGATMWELDQDDEDGEAVLPSDFSNSAKGDPTTWAYDSWTGLMSAKTDAAAESVTYTYNPRGQLSVRTLARGGTATHTYFDTTPTLTGELKKVDYSGTITPDVEYTYNRAGQTATVLDALGTRSFTYNAALRLTKEVLPNGFLGNLQINHAYESSGAHRRTSLEVGPSTDTDRDLKDVYAYHASTGRLSTIAAHYSGGPRTFTYSYLPGTDLVDSVSSGYYERSTYWQSFRRLEDAVETTWNGSLRASYLYGYDLEGRRLAENVTGPITTKWDAGWTHGFQMSWSYTGRGEIDLTKTRLLDGSGQPTGSWVSSWERDWNWDDVSNRTFEDHVDDQQDRTYSANSLNQYNWYEEDEHQYNFNHDDDGNLTDDGTWSYTYDLEDRVIGMSKSGITLSFTYDYLGRRVRKVASGGAYPGTYEYVYDGFNAIAIYRNDARMGSYTWGPDKTGTLHGAGGVGGLLMVRNVSNGLSFPMMDARGNVTGMLDSSGNIYRAYQFDAFGNTVGYVLNAGVQSMDFIGFAGNFTDIESGLVDFGMRLYQPKHGRFIHRDPIGEAGGENLYAHTWNDPVNRWDLLGMIDPDEQDRLAREQDIFLWDTFSQNRDTMMEPGFEYYFSYQQGAGQLMSDHLGFLNNHVHTVFVDNVTGKIVGAANVWGNGFIDANGSLLSVSGSFQIGTNFILQTHNTSPEMGNRGGSVPGNLPATPRLSHRDNGRDVSVVAGGNSDDGDYLVDITLRVRFKNQFGGRYRMENTIDRWINGIESTWTGIFGRYDVSTEVINMTGKSGPALNVWVWARLDGYGRFGAESTNFQDSTSAWAAAHEAGHWLGLPDLYTEEAMHLYPQLYYKSDGNLMKSVSGSVWERDITSIIERNHP
ncbi:MAG: RHS repeat-associated core domain-containing protein [Opitutaceae bacterium]